MIIVWNPRKVDGSFKKLWKCYICGNNNKFLVQLKKNYYCKGCLIEAIKCIDRQYLDTMYDERKIL